jgi:NAD-dependent dihydropyrimidine dehydrogenase PreA subunit
MLRGEKKKMVETEYEGLPRNKIPWDPKIDNTRCTVCGKCTEFCHMNAFKTENLNDKKKTTIIINPNKCVVFCRGCESICPQNAISHPDEKETRKIIDQLHNKRPMHV